MERSRPLHNFNLPPGLTWGRQRFLRCMNVNPVRAMPAADDDESSDSGELNDVQDRRIDSEEFEKRKSSGNSRRSLRFMLPSSPAKEIRQNVARDDDDEISVTREKLVMDFQTEVGRMKEKILKNNSSDDERSTRASPRSVSVVSNPMAKSTFRQPPPPPHSEGGGGGGSRSRSRSDKLKEDILKNNSSDDEKLTKASPRSVSVVSNPKAKSTFRQPPPPPPPPPHSGGSGSGKLKEEILKNNSSDDEKSTKASPRSVSVVSNPKAKSTFKPPPPHSGGSGSGSRGGSRINAEVDDPRSEKKSARPRRNLEKKEDQRPRFSITLSKKEIEDDFIAMTGKKPPRRPKRRPKNVNTEIEGLFPGLWLTEIHPDRYKVNENGKL